MNPFLMAVLAEIIATALGIPVGDILKVLLWKLIAIVGKWLGVPDAQTITNATTNANVIAIATQDNTDTDIGVIVEADGHGISLMQSEVEARGNNV